MGDKPTRADVLDAIRRGAIHDFPRSGGPHASGIGVAMRIGLSHAGARACLEQLAREGRIVQLSGEDMWRIVE